MDPRALNEDESDLKLSPVSSVAPEIPPRLPTISELVARREVTLPETHPLSSTIPELAARPVWVLLRPITTRSSRDKFLRDMLLKNLVRFDTGSPPRREQQASGASTSRPPSEETPRDTAPGTEGMNANDCLQLANISEPQTNEDEGSGQPSSLPGRSARSGSSDGASAPANKGSTRPPALQNGGDGDQNRKECNQCHKLVHKKHIADHMKGHLFSSQETLEAPPHLRCKSCAQKKRPCRILVKPWAREANTTRCQFCIQYKEICNFTQKPPEGLGAGIYDMKHPIAIAAESASQNEGSSGSAAEQ